MITKLSNLIDSIEEGNINPLDIYKQVKQDVDDINALFDRIKEMAITDAEIRGKEEVAHEGFELREGRIIRDFSKDEEWTTLNTKLKARAELIKDSVPYKKSKSSLIIKKQ